MKLNLQNVQQSTGQINQAQGNAENDLLALLANGDASVLTNENHNAFLNELKNQLSTDDEAQLLNVLNATEQTADSADTLVSANQIQATAKHNLLPANNDSIETLLVDMNQTRAIGKHNALPMNNDSVQALLGDMDTEQVEMLLKNNADGIVTPKINPVKMEVQRAPAVLDGMQSVEDLVSPENAIESGILQTQSTEDFLLNRTATKNNPHLLQHQKMTQQFLKNSDPTQMFKMMNHSETAQLNSINGKVDLKLNAKATNDELINNIKTSEVSEFSFANSGESFKDIVKTDSLNLGEIKTQSVENNGASKLFKMESMTSTDLADTEKLISKISDYIIQSKTSSEPRVEMSISHKEFGVMDIIVEKMSRSSDELNIVIRGQSELGRSVLGQNQNDLLTSLAKSGVQVADFKIESSASNSTGQFTQGEHGQAKHDGSAANKQFGSSQNQKDHESQKRQELWDVLYSRNAA